MATKVIHLPAEREGWQLPGNESLIVRRVLLDAFLVPKRAPQAGYGNVYRSNVC
jgi:hypothetical protein